MTSALTGDPWSMFGHYLTMKQWDPTFDLEKIIINSTGVWVRISRLPFSMYEKSMLWAMGMAIGKPIRIDEHTLRVS